MLARRACNRGGGPSYLVRHCWLIPRLPAALVGRIGLLRSGRPVRPAPAPAAGRTLFRR